MQICCHRPFARAPQWLPSPADRGQALIRAEHTLCEEAAISPSTLPENFELYSSNPELPPVSYPLHPLPLPMLPLNARPLSFTLLSPLDSTPKSLPPDVGWVAFVCEPMAWACPLCCTSPCCFVIICLLSASPSKLTCRG